MPLPVTEAACPSQVISQSPSSSPLVSVIIPAFNCENFIAAAINSALAQDYLPLEVIVVDDGSTDGTRDIISTYGNQVRLISQGNSGCAAARNLGLTHARGTYVAFLDADDVWWPQKISYQIQAMLETGFKMAYSRFILWHSDPDGTFPPENQMFATTDDTLLSDCALVTGDTYKHLLLDCFVWTSTVIIERAELEKTGFFDEKLQLGEDYDLWLRLSRNIGMLGLEVPTALYRQHPNSITRKAHDTNYEYLILWRALAKWGEGGCVNEQTLSGPMRKRLAKSMFDYAYRHYKNGSPGIASAAYLKSMRYSGIRWKPLVLYVICKFMR